LGGALKNQEAKITSLFLDPWLNLSRYHSRDVRFTVEIWPASRESERRSWLCGERRVWVVCATVWRLHVPASSPS